MTLCLGQLKKYFGRLLLVFCMLLVGVSTGLTSASASDGEHFAWSDNSWGYDNPNFQGTITSGTDQVLFCFYRQSRNNDNAPYIAFNGDNLTTYKTLDYDAGKYRFAYLVNPDVGTYSITNPSGGYISAVRCVVKENVSQSQPVNYATDWIASSNSSYGYTMASSSTSILLNYGGYNNTGNTFDNLDFFDGGSAVGQGTTHYVASWGTDNATSTFWISPLSNTEKLFTITEVNKALPEPANSIEWLSDKSYLYADVNSNFSEAVSYDFSEDFYAGGLYSVELYCDGHLFTKELDGETDGKGVVIFDVGTGADPVSCDDAYFYIYDSVSETTLAESDNFSMYLLDVQNLGDTFIILNNSLLLTINPETTPTTTLFFSYNIDENFLASSTVANSKICLTNTDYGNIIPSAVCQDLTNMYGGGGLAFPSFSDKTTTFKFDLVSEDNLVLYSSVEFTVSFLGGLYTPVDECAEDMGFLGESVCNLKVKYLNPTISFFINALTKIFPFNIFAGVNTAWKNSANQTLPTAFDFLPFPNNDGNMMLSIPDKYSAEIDKQVCIFGSCAFKQNEQMIALFNGMRGLSTYAFWFGFIMGLIVFAKRLWAEINE
jgi:hypothetical protein